MATPLWYQPGPACPLLEQRRVQHALLDSKGASCTVEVVEGMEADAVAAITIVDVQLHGMLAALLAQYISMRSLRAISLQACGLQSADLATWWSAAVAGHSCKSCG